MKLQFRPILAMLVLLSVPLAKAQTGSGDSSQSGSSGSSQSGSTESSPQDQSGNGPQQVFTQPQNTPSLGFLDEVTSHNAIKLGLSASAAYDTNASAYSTPSYSQTQGLFSSSIMLTQTRPKVTWNLSAVAGLNTSNIPGYTTTGNVDAGLGVLYQISQRWQLNVSDTYLYLADPFQQYLSYMSAPIFNQPNPTTYTPLTTSESNYGLINLTYQMSARDSLTFTGIESFSQYINGSYSTSLYSWYSWGGAAQYQHVFSARLSAGGSYNYTAVDYGHGQSRSGIQSIEGFASYKLNPHMFVTGWVGPQYTATKNLIPIFCTPFGCYIQVFHNASWTPALGGNFGWSGQRDFVALSFAKQITNGGILFGITKVYQVRGVYSRQLTPLWSFSLSALYGNDSGYATQFHAQHLTSFTGSAGLVRQLTPALSATVTYAYFDQTSNNVFGGTVPKWIDNRFQFTLQYTWGHSLGR